MQDGARESWGNNKFLDMLKGGNKVNIEPRGLKTKNMSFNISRGGGGLPSITSLKAPITTEEGEKIVINFDRVLGIRERNES